jgi:hypothetical protein
LSTIAQLFANAPSTEVLTEGYTLEADDKGYYGSIRFWFAGADLWGFTSTASGLAQTMTVGGSSVTRLIPLIHPYISGANCYCDSIKVYPAPDSVASWDGTAIAFADYFADVHFATYSYPMESGDQPTVTLDLQGGSEMVTRPGWAYKMLSDGKPINHDVGVPVTTVDFTLTMHRLSSLDTSLYTSLAGSVNSTTFWGQAAGTVLYRGPGVQGQQSIGGFPAYDAAHAFQFRSVPHNQIMRDDGAGFDTPVLVSDGSTAMIPSADLNQLWGV